MKVVYWTQTGNTKEMADAVAEGIQKGGQEAQVVEFDSITPGELDREEKFALGCPAMGAESLEEDSVEPFITALEGNLSGKKVALFGSYGWGGGEWMNDWEERMKQAGATVVDDKGVICLEAPDEETLEACRSLGEALAKL